MKVRLGQHLENYLHEHDHHTISLELMTTPTEHLGERFLLKPRMPEPRIIFNRPTDTTMYDKYLIDDITVFVSQKIEAINDELVIMDQVVDGKDTCYVDGWKNKY